MEKSETKIWVKPVDVRKSPVICDIIGLLAPSFQSTYPESVESGDTTQP